MHGGGHYHYRTKNSVTTKLRVYWHQNANIPADYVQYNSHNIPEALANWRVFLNISFTKILPLPKN